MGVESEIGLGEWVKGKGLLGGKWGDWEGGAAGIGVKAAARHSDGYGSLDPGCGRVFGFGGPSCG